MKTLRNVVCLTLLAIMIFALAACGGSGSAVPAPALTPGAEATDAAQTGELDPSASPNTTAAPKDEAFYVVDFNDTYATMGMQQIFETADSVYYLCSPTLDTSVVYFSDKEYKDWMPLCSKPNCMHGPKDNDCNAHLDGVTNLKMWLYGGHIYYCTCELRNSQISLWRMKLDGSDHERLLELPEAEGSSFGWFFHNKYLFVYYASSTGTSGEIKKTTYCVELGETTPKAREFKLVDENGEPAELCTVIIGRGDELFCFSNDPFGDNYIYRVDISRGTRKTVCRLPAYLGLICTALYDDTLQFCYGWDLGEIITADINTGELTVLNKAEPQTMKWDQSYRRYIFGSATANSLNPSLKGTTVYDYYGGIINDIPYESYNTDITISYILGDYVFGHDYYEEGANVMEETPQWYLDIRDIGTENLMWRRWAPEE